MSFQDVIFFSLSAILLFAGLRVITARNPVHAALYLVLAFFTAAGIWLLLEAEFLAIALVLVYVGAVMVLFLFVVMMLDINLDRLREGFWESLPVALPVGILMAIEMALILGTKHFGVERVSAPAPHPAGYSNTAELGRVLYTDYLLTFELAAVILLVAIVAAIAPTVSASSACRPRWKCRWPNRIRRLQPTARSKNNGRLVALLDPGLAVVRHQYHWHLPQP
jgi:NADH-quinone oxidoreductase subunit J